VRIALNLKRVAYGDVFHDLRRNEQNAPAFLAINPQGLLPTLVVDAGVLTQSLAICEYLDEILPEPPLLPDDLYLRARVRAFSQVIACDTHPVQNLKILNRLRAAGLSEEAVTDWARTTIAEGLLACANLIAERVDPFSFGNTPGLADLCLVPQLVNARRFGVDLVWPRLLEIEAQCLNLEAFNLASPARQPDAG